jgi:hypothetical protein
MDASACAEMQPHDLVAAFNACTTPKEAAKLFGSFQDSSFSKAIMVRIAVESNKIEVCCTTLAGAVKEECCFLTDATVAQLADKLQFKFAADDMPFTSLTFFSEDGEVVNTSDRLQDHAQLVVKASLSSGDVGRILYQAKGTVSVDFLGQCLGNHGEFWKEMAVSYPKNFTCFAGMGLVEAIRAYLWGFRLPGEAAQIERIIEGFARAYFSFNDTDEIEAVDVDNNDGDSTTDGERPPKKSKSHGNEDEETESDEEAQEARKCRSCWDKGVHGWYVHQPFTGPQKVPCCIHCGALDGENGSLEACRGCEVAHFCRRCRRSASRYGHAVVGTIGYGRACVAARNAAGSLGTGGAITYMRNGRKEIAIAPSKSLNWAPQSPFKDQDAVMVLSYAIIMLTTNLHSANVKDKMKKHEFIKQNRDVNGGGNFPGDFLSKIYDNIAAEPLGIMMGLA